MIAVSERIVSIFDDFAPDAADVREQVIAKGFSSETGPDGGTYTGISQLPVPHWPARIAQLLECEIIPRLSCFRLNLAGELPHSWVHSDEICAEFASVLYLNTPEQCKGGTAFWKHEALKIDRFPTKDQLAKQGIHAEWFQRMIEREWKDLAFWKQWTMVEMRWNRFITYPTRLFHSRFPFEGFGHGPSDGRLIWVCFYDKVQK